MPRIDYTKNWIRKRQIEPKEFVKSSFRTKVINKNTELVMGKLKQSHKWAVQSIRIRR